MPESTEEETLCKVDEKTVENISNLVDIELSEEEISLFAQQLSQILTHFRRIDEVDTRNVEPTFHVMDMKNVVREDGVSSCLTRRLVFKNASKKEDDLFKAPRIL